MADVSYRRIISFSWDIHWRCNYRCPYCWWHNRWDEISAQNYYPGVNRLIEVWERLYKQYGSTHIEISGGEPLLYSEFSKFVSGILKYHTVGINTNLSENVSEMVEKLKDSNKDRLKLGATFHPSFANFDAFLKRAEHLRKNNFTIGISYLAWPPQIKDIPSYREKFAKAGFKLSVLTFWGKYDEKNYPGAYTALEKEIIGSDLGSRAGEEFQIEPFETFGRKCNAGCIYATIHPDGEALRCGGGSWEKEDGHIGNIFDDNFRFLKNPLPCPSKNCPCNEWAFLLVHE